MAVPQPGPKPISWEPSGLWDGIDGQWSSFNISTGSPPQTSRVLPASAGFATFVVMPEGCYNSSVTDCAFWRGGLFHRNASRTWIDQGQYALGIEQNLGPKFNVAGYYGLDTVSIGTSSSTNTTSLPSQVVAGMVANIHYTGLFGLRYSPANLSTFDDPHPSYLASLKAKSMIPSLSWAYTAGASYRNGTFGALASLTLGGYDSERFVPNNVSFTMAPDIDRDLVVDLRSVESTTRNGSTISFLESPIQTYIDSTIPRMIFPQKTADLIAANFGLQYDPKRRMYFMPEKVHAGLSRVNPNITFTLGNSLKGGPTIDIVLPYSSFDLFIQEQRYFPLQVGNDSTFCLGRPFLQEAYIITNYEHHNFSISQTRFDNLNSTRKNLVALPAATATPTLSGNPPMIPTVAPTSTSEPSKGGLSQGARAGVIAGTTSAIAVSFMILALFFWRWRKYKKTHPKKPLGQPQVVSTLQKQELDGHGISYKPKFAPVAYSVDYKNDKKLIAAYGDAELGAHGEILEMPGPDNPDFQELMAGDVCTTRGRNRKPKTSYAALFGNKFSSGRQHAGRENAVQPPVSKFCRIPMGCIPGRERGSPQLDKELPPTPTPALQCPAPTRLASPLPNVRRVIRTPVL